MSRAPREAEDSASRARAVFVDARARARLPEAGCRSLERLAGAFRIVAVGRGCGEVPGSAEGVAEFARANAIELYASWFVGTAPALGFQGVFAGGGPRAAAEALSTIEAREAESRIILGDARLESLVATLKGRGAKIVFTNGVFDLLHIGHLRLLESARRLGDVLMVAINSDDSTRKIKGASRPIVPQFARAETLLSLRAVDYCLIFTDTDPRRILAVVRPDVLAKGSDYSFTRVVGARFVTGYGGSVARLPLVDGCSTTSTIRRIHDRGGRA